MLTKIKWKNWLLPLALGLGIWLLTPLKPAAISTSAWQMFAILSLRLPAA